MREFQEETGYDKNNLSIMKNMYTFDEIFTGSNLKSYKHRYFLCYIDYKNTVNTNNYQKSEIGDMKWFEIHDVIDKIRVYNIEKINLIKRIDSLLTINRIS